MGRIFLPITLGTAPKNVTKIVDFLVIKNMSGYNAILDRGLIGQIKAVPSSLHQKMKFLTPSEIREVLGCQRESRRCYVLSLRDKQPLAAPVPVPPPTDQPSTSRGTPAKDLLPFSGRLEDEKKVYIQQLPHKENGAVEDDATKNAIGVSDALSASSRPLRLPRHQVRFPFSLLFLGGNHIHISILLELVCVLCVEGKHNPCDYTYKLANPSGEAIPRTWH
ncbi:hypothetical protein Taro_006659, partial [Colocasia esculenta]|nr:hypothetical protein [Colocasia esculenta]